MIPKITQEMIDKNNVKYWSCEDLMDFIGKSFQFDENGNYALDSNVEYTEDEVVAIQATCTKNGTRIFKESNIY